MATIGSEEVAPWIARLKERMVNQGISVQEAHDRELAEHPKLGIVLELAKQAIRQEEAERESQQRS